MKNTFLKIYFYSETDSGAASDFQKGQYRQWRGFSNELRSWWCYSSSVHSRLSQTPLSYRTLPWLYPASDWLSPCWQPVSKMHLLLFQAYWGGPWGKALAGCEPMPRPVHCQWRAAVSACREEEKMVMALWLVQEEAAFCCWDAFGSWFGGVRCSHTGGSGKGVKRNGLWATSVPAMVGPRKCAAAFEF